ncbi:MAG TPA: TonB-dependent receptor, partial [Flavisolibacter sp.]|nr:TonB-dependent receptor [Flavisolibacter sp.]
YSQEKDSSDLAPVEVRAIRASLTAPFAKTNISKKEIASQNLGQDLPFLLNQTPSVVINSDAGNGVGYTYIHIRGTDVSRINVTLNGIPYNDAESQGTFFVDLPDIASSINNIQIQRGVGTSTNGAGAFGATINFSTNEINRQQYVELNNSYGSFYTLKNTIKAGTGLMGKHFTTDIRLSRISSSGYIDRAFSNLRSLFFSTAYISDKTQLRFNIIAGKEKTYQAWYGVSESDLPIHRTINYAGNEQPGTPYPNETDNYWQNHYQLFFTQKILPELTFNTGLFYTKGYGYYEEYRGNQDYADYHMSYPVNGADTIFTTNLVRQLWLDNDFYGNIFSLQKHTKESDIILGGAITHYTGSHYGLITWSQLPLTGAAKWYNVNAQKNDLNIYGKWQEKLNKNLEFYGDLQFRKVNYNLNGFEHNLSLFLHPQYNFINPKAGLTYTNHNWIVYASFSIANKEPNRDDFEASLQQQPKPEHLEDYEFGIEKKYSKANWSVNYYYMNYKDQLVLTGKINDVGAYTRTNIPESYRTGIELQGLLNLTQWMNIKGNFTISKNKVLNYTEYIDDYDNGFQKTNFYKESDISFSPSKIAAGTLSLIPFKKTNIDFISKYVDKQYLDNSENNGRKLNAYFTEDIRMKYSFETKLIKDGEIIFQVYNVFNKNYEPNGYSYAYYLNNHLITENNYFPMAGTNWMIGLNIKL